MKTIQNYSVVGIADRLRVSTIRVTVDNRVHCTVEVQLDVNPHVNERETEFEITLSLSPECPFLEARTFSALFLGRGFRHGFPYTKTVALGLAELFEGELGYSEVKVIRDGIIVI